MRPPLTFSDDKGNTQTWVPDSRQFALESFREFATRHRNDSTWLRIDDEENEESLSLHLEAGTVCRVKGGQNPRTEYRLLVTTRGDWREANLFIQRGFDALDSCGQWQQDLAGLARTRMRHAFDESVLRRSHPRETRRRLEILTRIDGHEPVTVDGVTHYGFGNGGGDTVNAWFGADGRGLVVTFDHSSELNFYEDARAQAALYEGVPADILSLVRNLPETDTTLNAPHPDGGTLVAATGIFHYSGPCAMADGLVSRLQETQTSVEDTGVGWLLDVFLAMPDFTPGAVSEAVAWWDAEDIASGFAANDAQESEQPALTPLDREELTRFCRIWADSGYNDRWDVHYILFDGDDIEDAGDTRDEFLRLIRTLGLEQVDAPPGGGTGEVWVRTDPRIDAELGNWA